MTAFATLPAPAPVSSPGRPGKPAAVGKAGGFEALMARVAASEGSPGTSSGSSPSGGAGQVSAERPRHAGRTGPEPADAPEAAGANLLQPDWTLAQPDAVPFSRPPPAVSLAGSAEPTAAAPGAGQTAFQSAPWSGLQTPGTAGDRPEATASLGSRSEPVRDGTPIRQVRDPASVAGSGEIRRTPGREPLTGPDSHVPGRPTGATPMVLADSGPAAPFRSQPLPSEILQSQILQSQIIQSGQSSSETLEVQAPGLPSMSGPVEADRPARGPAPDRFVPTVPAASAADSTADGRAARLPRPDGTGPSAVPAAAVTPAAIALAPSQTQAPPGGPLQGQVAAEQALSAGPLSWSAEPRGALSAEPGQATARASQAGARRSGPAATPDGKARSAFDGIVTSGILARAPALAPQGPLVDLSLSSDPSLAGSPEAAMTEAAATFEDDLIALPAVAPQGRSADSAGATPVASAPVRGAPETVARLAAGMIDRLEARSGRFDLQLDPLGMGSVDVRVQIGADGQLTASLGFESAKAAADLRGRADELRQSLEQAGFTVADDGLSFDFTGQGQGQQDRPAPDLADSRRGGAAFARALVAQEAPPVVSTRFRTVRGLDVLI